MKHRKQIQHRATRKFTLATPATPAKHPATAIDVAQDFRLPESDAELRDLVDSLCRRIAALREAGARLANERQHLEIRNDALTSELAMLKARAPESDSVRAQTAERDAQWALAQQHAVQGQIAHARTQESENEKNLQQLCGQRQLAMGEAADRNPDAPFIVTDHAIVRFFERSQGLDARALIGALAPHLGPVASDHYLLELLRHHAGVDVDALRATIGSCRVRAEAELRANSRAPRDVPINRATGLLARIMNNTVVTVIYAPTSRVRPAPKRTGSTSARAWRAHDHERFEDARFEDGPVETALRVKSSRTRAMRARDEQLSEAKPFANELWFAARVLGNSSEAGADPLALALAPADNILPLRPLRMPEAEDFSAANAARWAPLLSLLDAGASDAVRELGAGAQAMSSEAKTHCGAVRLHAVAA